MQRYMPVLAVDPEFIDTDAIYIDHAENKVGDYVKYEDVPKWKSVKDELPPERKDIFIIITFETMPPIDPVVVRGIGRYVIKNDKFIWEDGEDGEFSNLEGAKSALWILMEDLMKLPKPEGM